MNDWHSHNWLQKISMAQQQGSLGGVLPTSMHQFGWWDFACNLLLNHNIHGENGFYQWWAMYALKSKSVLDMHFPTIWRFKFTDLVNSKKTQSLGTNGWRQKCLDKRLG